MGAAAVTMALTLTACTGSAPADRSAPVAKSVVWVRSAKFPVAPVPTPDGGLLYGERLSGRVRSVDARGVLAPTPIAAVGVAGALDDQRGLLGLARISDGGLYASWTRREDRRLVVGELAPTNTGAPRLVWVGPVSADRANGGTLAIAANGELLIGIGDLLEPRTLADRSTRPNRKILMLDPAGPPTQIPRIVSRGWNNPYALAVGRDGTPWVADNAGGAMRERIGRADRPASAASPLGPRRHTIAPSGLVELGRGRLGVCGFVSRRVVLYRVVDGVIRATGVTVAQPCATGVTRLTDGRIATLTETAVFVSPAAA